MKTEQIPTWLRNAGSLTALGSLGGSLGYLAYGAYPALKDAGLTLEQLAALGGAIGSTMHFVGLPVLRYVFDYVQLGKVAVLRKIGVIRSDEADECRKNIIEQHFAQPRSEGRAQNKKKKTQSKRPESKSTRHAAPTPTSSRPAMGRRASKSARKKQGRQRDRL